MPSLSDFFVQSENLSRTIFTIIHDELVERILAVTERIVGDLDKPGNGILIVLPVDSCPWLDRVREPPSPAAQ